MDDPRPKNVLAMSDEMQYLKLIFYDNFSAKTISKFRKNRSKMKFFVTIPHPFFSYSGIGERIHFARINVTDSPVTFSVIECNEIHAHKKSSGELFMF